MKNEIESDGMRYRMRKSDVYIKEEEKKNGHSMKGK